jgi:hypothetical protein
MNFSINLTKELIMQAVVYIVILYALYEIFSDDRTGDKLVDHSGGDHEETTHETFVNLSETAEAASQAGENLQRGFDRIKNAKLIF